MPSKNDPNRNESPHDMAEERWQTPSFIATHSSPTPKDAPKDDKDTMHPPRLQKKRRLSIRVNLGNFLSLSLFMLFPPVRILDFVVNIVLEEQATVDPWTLEIRVWKLLKQFYPHNNDGEVREGRCFLDCTLTSVSWQTSIRSNCLVKLHPGNK